MTDADVTIPAANPPMFAVISVFAHALLPGTAGNIQAGDIDTTISNGILVKNLGPFYGGKNARTYHTVTADDINTLATAVQAQLTNLGIGKLSKQLQTGEDLATPQCHMSIASAYKIGQETDKVVVSVNGTCKASAYSVGRLKKYLAGKDTQAIIRQFHAYGQIAIAFDGVGDSSRLPKEHFIHLIFIVQEEQS